MSADAPQLSYIAYETFLADVEAVGEKLKADGWRPDFLIGIGRGGLVPAAYLSHRLGIAMLSAAIVAVQAFRRSGRLSVIVRMPSSSSVRICSKAML